MSFALMLQGLTAAKVQFVVVGGVAAAAHGSAHVTNDLDVCYDIAPANVARLATLLATWEAYPRGIDRDLPFFMDERQFRSTPLMTLTTREGELNVLDRVNGVGGFDQCLASSVELEAFDVRFSTLSLEALIRAKRAAGRPKDIAQLPELEALLALRRGQR